MTYYWVLTAPQSDLVKVWSQELVAPRMLELKMLTGPPTADTSDDVIDKKGTKRPLAKAALMDGPSSSKSSSSSKGPAPATGEIVTEEKKELNAKMLRMFV